MFAHDIGLCFLRVCPHMTKSFAENICIIINTLITLWGALLGQTPSSGSSFRQSVLSCHCRRRMGWSGRWSFWDGPGNPDHPKWWIFNGFDGKNWAIQWCFGFPKNGFDGFSYWLISILMKFWWIVFWNIINVWNRLIIKNWESLVFTEMKFLGKLGYPMFCWLYWAYPNMPSNFWADSLGEW